MKTYTQEEIKAKVAELWDVPDEYGYKNTPKMEVDIEEGGTVNITISKMYDAPGLTFAQLKALSDFFETTNITDERYSIPGCETCDYGSDYGFTLTIKE